MKTDIKEIYNYYGCLSVRAKKGKYYWGIRCYTGEHRWKEIPQSLYDEILKHWESVKNV